MNKIHCPYCKSELSPMEILSAKSNPPLENTLVWMTCKCGKESPVLQHTYLKVLKNISKNFS